MSGRLRDSIPAEISASPDRRALGLCVAALTLDGGFGVPRGFAVGDPRLCIGFHAVERDGERGVALDRRPRAVAGEPVGRTGENAFPRVDLAGPALPRWVAPARYSESLVGLFPLVA